MICVVTKSFSSKGLYGQIFEALEYADLIELRLDSLKKLDIEELRNLRSHFSIPMIFTLRKASQGGDYNQSEENRLADIRRLMILKPEYLDLEHDVPSLFIEEMRSQHPTTKLILSYHDFIGTPDDLEGIYQEMQKIPAYFYKIAVTAHNSLDAFRLMCWIKKKSKSNLIAISMGSHGQISRILAPIIGCPMTYAVLDENSTTAPGQFSAKILIERYHYKSLNAQTAIYGLIGDPVDQSISDKTHNNVMSLFSLNAVYVKTKVTPSELASFLLLAKELSFHGLSVTMPLKEKVMDYLDEIDSEAARIGAVNTLLFENGKIKGFNTDGVGALNAIEQECLLKDKRIVIIGAGGAAKAIGYEAMQRGCLVTIVNRDKKKAFELAQRLHCAGLGLESMNECAKAGYDVLINCTPAPLPIDLDDIIAKTIVMDIKTRPKETLLLIHAREKKCSIIYGYMMFVEQAVGQHHIWFKDKINLQECRKILESIAEF